jgi:hypothetical protein
MWTITIFDRINGVHGIFPEFDDQRILPSTKKLKITHLEEK